ncbi:hypothetical protein Daus18300_007749 [Diaporthe australafricana]|uniref:Aminoglycoside phosphotransferase domain-containing protein n=1 Tax=Diaporthe australafricana TaxID=127596 RepID=A0ABR3WLC3_9PEZI
MEYVRGETVNSLLQKSFEPPEQTQAKQEELFRRVAFAFEELLRIPVPPNTPPSSVSGSYIRHPFFKYTEAPRLYDNAEQLEQHINLLVRNLSKEPMVYCFSDLNGGNFIINDDEIVVVDFADLNILPLTFAKYLLLVHGYDGLGPHIRPWVNFADTDDDPDNVSVLVKLQAPLVQSNTFDEISDRIPGGRNPDVEQNQA